MNAQDTFSIVAVDSETGEVGSAGATCLDTQQEGLAAIIISDVLPGRGAIHTQSYWNTANQANARQKMEEGLSPEELMAYLQANDVQFNATVRQYGAVDFDENGQPRAAAFTGSNCLDEKGHRVGDHYAIQGNILLDEWILDSMQAAFLEAEGSLAERLMAAMQGANVAGADSRCLNEGVSSRSAFLRVARPDDAEDNLFLDLNIPFTPFGEEPIDALQAQFDAWQSTNQTELDRLQTRIQVFPNPSDADVQLYIESALKLELSIYATNGQKIHQQLLQAGQHTLLRSVFPAKGTYLLHFAQANRPETKLAVKKLIIR
ncbi:MAG: DUF1028 domain-containing protein [Saprospiraceae bacterium]|nr:DUF1028 domain-containing protein [Saprospiraceae bacterium]